MKGSDYFPISKFSAENYANLYRCPGPPHRKSGPEVCRQQKKPRFHAQKQATSGSTAAEGRAGFSRSAEAELPTSHRRFDRAGTMAQNSALDRKRWSGEHPATGNGSRNAEQAIGQQLAGRQEKREKKPARHGWQAAYGPYGKSSETDGSQEARLNLFGYTRGKPPPKRQGAGQIRPLCFVAERIVTANRRLRPRSCGIPRLPRGLPAYRRSKSSR